MSEGRGRTQSLVRESIVHYHVEESTSASGTESAVSDVSDSSSDVDASQNLSRMSQLSGLSGSGAGGAGAGAGAGDGGSGVFGAGGYGSYGGFASADGADAMVVDPPTAGGVFRTPTHRPANVSGYVTAMVVTSPPARAGAGASDSAEVLFTPQTVVAGLQSGGDDDDNDSNSVTDTDSDSEAAARKEAATVQRRRVQAASSSSYLRPPSSAGAATSAGPSSGGSAGAGDPVRSAPWSVSSMPMPRARPRSRSKGQLNEYEMMEVIGKGAYGIVRLVRDMNNSRFYAMKIINRRELNKRNRFSRNSNTPTDKLQREIAILKKLLHPNVIRLFQVIEDPKEDKLYLIMEYMQHGSIGEVGDSPQHLLSAERCRGVLRNCVLGLHYIHEQGIIHADIKPDNLLADFSGVVKLSDFGVSHVCEPPEDDVINRTEGTMAFHAPEMCAGEPYHGRPADVWALGVTIYHLAFGRLPFWSASPVQMYEAIQNDDFSIPLGTHPGLVHVLERMLDKDPKSRITLRELMEDSWLTEGGARPLQQLQRPSVQITADDILDAITPIDRVVLLSKIKSQMSRLLTRIRTRKREQAASADAVMLLNAGRARAMSADEAMALPLPPGAAMARPLRTPPPPGSVPLPPMHPPAHPAFPPPTPPRS